MHECVDEYIEIDVGGVSWISTSVDRVISPADRMRRVAWVAHCSREEGRKLKQSDKASLYPT